MEMVGGYGSRFSIYKRRGDGPVTYIQQFVLLSTRKKMVRKHWVIVDDQMLILLCFYQNLNFLNCGSFFMN